jgi:membrane peptidoglycan carboxypeptidase
VSDNSRDPADPNSADANKPLGDEIDDATGEDIGSDADQENDAGDNNGPEHNKDIGVNADGAEEIVTIRAADSPSARADAAQETDEPQKKDAAQEKDASTENAEGTGHGAPAPERERTPPRKSPARKPPARGRTPRGRGEPPKRRSRPARYIRRIGFAVLGLVGCAVAGFAIAYATTPIPSSAQADAMAKGSTFYYSDGKTPFYQEGRDRRPVKLEQVPQSVRLAVIAAENRSFYADPGVSISGTARALWSTVSGAQVQGGSTITQQMVRNYYSGLSQRRTVSRKFKEIMVALKVGNEKDKDWILEQYLNTIYFGRSAYGIQAAAHAYFDTDVGHLTPAESAYLAAAIQTPSTFALPEYQGYALARWQYVVDGMVKLGAISPGDAAAMTFPKPDKEAETPSLRGQTGYMWQLAKLEATKDRGYTEDQIKRGGLKIVTTFNKNLMDAAEHAVTSQLPKGTPKQVRAGLAAVNPANGEVEAFYGGRDYLKQQYDTATQSMVQAGSGFKPYVLAAALSDGKELTDAVNGHSPQYFRGTHRCTADLQDCKPIKNNGNESYGMVNLVTATQRSINTAYVNLGLDIGLGKVMGMAEKAGIPKDQLTPNAGAPTLSIGVTAVSALQQAAGYATFAADGMHRTKHVIKSITDSDGHVHRFTATGTRAFSPSVAHDATYAMTKVVESGTGTNAQLPDSRPVAGKTGTTDKGKAIWFNGFVPQLATSVAMFQTDNKPLKIPGYSAYGGALPAQVWRVFMTDATKDMPPKDFGAPSTRVADHSGDRGVAATTAPRPGRATTAQVAEPSVPVEPSPQPTGPSQAPQPSPVPTLPQPTRGSSGPPHTKSPFVA